MNIKTFMWLNSGSASGGPLPAQVQETLPMNVTLPSISGSGDVGDPLFGDPGSWTGGGISYTYQWYLDGDPIGGANAVNYTPLTPGTYYLNVTAANSLGSADEDSNEIEVVSDFDPILQYDVATYTASYHADPYRDADDNPAADGEQVATRVDVSGNDAHFAQAIGADRGIYYDNQLPNGLGAVLYNGVNQYDTSSSALTGNATFISLFKSVSNEYYSRILTAGVVGTADYSSYNRIVAILQGAGSPNLIGSQQVVDRMMSAQEIPNEWNLMFVSYEAGVGFKFRLNGVEEEISSPLSEALNTTIVRSATSIAPSGPSAGDYWNGYKALDCVVKESLTFEQMDEIETYILSQTGVTL